MRNKFWNKNVVALGLASGFLEPLESTSIYLAQSGVTRLLNLFPRRDFIPLLAERYNRESAFEYERIRDFLILHYHATQRTDSPFWDYVRTMEIPASLAEKMTLFRRRGRVVKYREGAFLDASWVSVYLGQRVLPDGHDPRADAPTIDSLAAGMERLRGEIEAAVGGMADHRDFLAGYCPMPAAA